MGDLRGLDGGKLGHPGGQGEMPSIDEQKRAGAMQLAIQSFAGIEVSHDGLVKRAKVIHEYLTTGQ